MRRLRVDELPQLLNILKGEMSAVGPRPEILSNVDKYVAELPEYSYRSRVKAGLTGYAQIAGKYNTTPREKLMMDISYIENYSFRLDIKLMLKTLTVFFNRDSTEAFEKDPSRADDEAV
jgi:lipopolysaccharide/colanic/teichoic acid biosynthesis glycosyltransferase